MREGEEMRGERKKQKEGEQREEMDCFVILKSEKHRRNT